MMGPGPAAVNQLPTPRATLKVSNIPSFVTGDDFSRLMLQLEGCVDARLLGRQPGGDQVGYGEFSDKMNASKAKNLYHGWTGWGGRGLAIELTDFPMAQLTQTGGPGQKRMREGDDLLQPGNNYKQARPDMSAMGSGMAGSITGGMSGGQIGMQQPAPQQDMGGLLQNLSNVTSLLQQQGIAQQLLAAAQQVGAGGSMAQPQQQGSGMLGQGGQQALGRGGMMGGAAMGQGGGGVYVNEPYNPAAVGPSNLLPQQPQQQMGGGSMMPQQQQQSMQHFQEPAMPQGAGGYMGAGPPMQQQPMMQGPPQQQYGMGPQAQPQMMQPSIGAGGGMVQPQHPQMQQHQQPSHQGMMQPGPQQGMGPGPAPNMQRGDMMAPPPVRQYPPDACNTLYIEGLPADVTRRELAHIFRGTEGFRSLRLVIKDSKKHAGEKLVMAFAEYTNTYFATEAMDKLQGYPFDLDDPETMNFFIKYARPMTGGRPSGPPPPLHRGPPVGRGGPDLGSARGPPPMMAGRGGGMMMEGRGRGGRGGGRFGPGGPPPRESLRRGY